MTWGSTLPAAVAQLTDTLTAALAPATHVQAWTRADAAAFMEAVTIGYQGDTSPEIAQGQFTAEGFVSNPDRESYAIRCVAAVRNGKGDTAAAASRAFTLFGHVGAVLAADRSLGGIVLSARAGDWTLTASPDARGVLAELAFDINVEAYTT